MSGASPHLHHNMQSPTPIVVQSVFVSSASEGRDPEAFPISGHSRQRLLETALRLFDERGLDATSARAVAHEAGHRNVGAVGYHFGDMRGLLHAVIVSHQERIDARRHQLLDELEATGNVTPRAAIEAMFTPHIELLDDPEGRQFLRVLNQVTNHPTWYPEASPEVWSSNQRGVVHLGSLWGHLPRDIQIQRALMAFGLSSFAVAERARLLDTDSPHRPIPSRDVFKDDLVTVMERIIGA